MDFLDPTERRKHTIRLILGYGLVAILIAFGTLILVFQAYGFDVDRKTGEVIQNGLVFVDSAPGGATILLNGKEQKNRTDTRIALPSSGYNLQIRKDGYREWKRSFELEGGTVERFDYPLLIPNKFERQEIQAYTEPPVFSSQSPDRRWMLVSQASSITNYIEYDLNALTNKKPDVRNVVFSPGLFRAAEGAHKIELVEWSTDNKHLLVKHVFAGGFEFVVLARDNPAASININTLTGQNPAAVTLRDKKFDQWYIHMPDGVLHNATADAPALVPLLSNVSVYKSHGEDVLLYAQPGRDGKSQRVALKQGRESYILRDLEAGKVHLEIARYDGAWYAVVGSDSNNKTFIFKDPVATLAQKDGTKAVPRAVLKSQGPLTQVAFSKNTRFVLAQSGQHFEIFDAEYNELYKYDAPDKFDADSKTSWMDGHRLLAKSGGKAMIFDFDGSNKQVLNPVLNGLSVYFDRDFEVLYSLDRQSANSPKTLFLRSDLRIEADR